MVFPEFKVIDYIEADDTLWERKHERKQKRPHHRDLCRQQP
jgi:hypothetical protein